MKLKIDYDLMNKIRHSKEGVKASEGFFEALKFMPATNIYNFFVIFSDLIYIAKNNNVNNIKIPIISLPLYILILTYSLEFKICSYVVKKNRSRIMDAATNDLNQLANQLIALEVKTSAELLKEAKLNQTDYKIVFSDNDIKIPKLKQTKEIAVPLTNGYEETILQEHIFGDEDYEISVGELDKKREIKLVKARMNA